MKFPGIYELFDGALGKPIFGYQIELFETLRHHKKVIINKSRQMGVTTFFAAYELTMAATEKKTLIIVSPSDRQSKIMFDYVLDFSDWTKANCKGYKELIKSETASTLSFKNGGKIISLPNSPETIRGHSADMLIMDEFAAFENPKKIWNAAVPMTTRGGRLAIISTPKGMMSMFADLWFKAKTCGFEPIRLNYRACTDLTEEKIKAEKATWDSISWRQEYENEFIDQKMTYFPTDLIDSVMDSGLVASNFPETLNGKMLIFGIDVGRKEDKTAIIGIDKEGVVCFRHTFQNTPFETQREFIAKLIPCASKMYVDSAGIGAQMAEELVKLGPGVVEAVVMNNEIKVKGFVTLRRLMEQKQIVLPYDDELKRALNLIERKQTGATLTFDAPRSDEAGHSDLAFALMLAVHEFGKEEEQKPRVAKRGWGPDGTPTTPEGKSLTPLLDNIRRGGWEFGV